MLKHLYRGIILICIFFGSVYYFGQDIKEEVFDMEQTIEMNETTFPVITLRIGAQELNLLHGYSNNLTGNIVRDSITPLDKEQSFDVVIQENENEVKRVIYELRSVVDNELIESDTINALTKEENKKTAKIKMKTVLEEGLEYIVKITLVTSESKKMNYYTRIGLIHSSYIQEKLDFVMNFHNSIMDKKKAEDMIAYLEPDDETVDTSLAYVNIHSSFDLVSWGNLEPKLVGNIVPTITEINNDMASIALNYMVSAETDSGLEYYYVKESYRVRYTSSRIYLLNYERSMESAFDINLASVAKSELKLGITNDSDIELVTSSDSNKLSFVSQRELWYYNLVENSAVKVFSFRQDNTDYVRDTYTEHGVRILNMDEEGNIDFIVYGYMNRGVYEGRVGIVLYRFHSADNRIEELVYIPMNITYQLLKEELDDFSYVNQLGTFYFIMNHKIYAYNLITKGLDVIASDVDKDNYIVSKEQHYLAWQDNNNPSKASNIIILDLETGDEQKISAEEGENINLLGKIDNNIIYGYVKTKEITTTVGGSTLVPMYQIEISDAQRNVLKEYSKSGYYVTGVTVDENVINLERMVKADGNNEISYEITDPDHILNRIIQEAAKIGLTTRVMEKTRTEQYISLTSGFSMETKPKFNDTINTIITEDTTLRIDDAEEMSEQYVTYAFGEIKGLFESAGEAINQADATVGSVLNSYQQIVWERGNKSSQSEINSIATIYDSQGIDSIMASAQMMVNYYKGITNSTKVDTAAGTALELLNQNLKDSVLDLTGCTLDEVLYYVSEKRPVLAMKDQDNAVLIIAYDTYNITVIDPQLHRTMKIGLGDGREIFTKAGNIFISYLKDKE